MDGDVAGRCLSVRPCYKALDGMDGCKNDRICGRGLHSSTSHLNLSRV